MNDGEDEKKSIHGDAAASLSRKSTICQCFDYGHMEKSKSLLYKQYWTSKLNSIEWESI